MDVSKITTLINTFRKLSQKNSVTPETLGHLMQQIVDALGSLVNDTEMDKLLQWYGSLQDETAVVSLSQNLSDRNEIHLDSNDIDLVTGERSTTSKALVIKQATTDRAGAMRAQQVTDLNAAKKGVTDLQSQVSQLSTQLTQQLTAVRSELSQVYEELARTDNDLAGKIGNVNSSLDDLVMWAKRIDYERPWQSDIPIYKIAGIVYHMSEADYIGSDYVYYAVADKMFFYFNEDRNPVYSVPHSKVLNGLYAPRTDAIYILGNSFYYFDGTTLATINYKLTLETINSRLDAIEAKLK